MYGTSTDFFVPASWLAMDASDLDLGGTTPVVFDLPGAVPSNLLVLFGKDQNAYLLDRDNLGGMGPPLFVAPLLERIVITAHVAFGTPNGHFVVTQGPGFRCPCSSHRKCCTMRSGSASSRTTTSSTRRTALIMTVSLALVSG